MRLLQFSIPLLLLMSCSGQEFEAETAIVRNSLKDPVSAQFRNLRGGKSNGSVCGEINAKNSFGGYVGFQPFVVVGGVAYMKPVESCSEAPTQSMDELARLSLEELQQRLDRLNEDIECQKAVVLVTGKIASECG